MKRYRIYKVLKWIFAGWALLIILSAYVWSDSAVMGNLEEVYDLNEATVQVLLGIINAVLAIFFKLQEDSNKPTVEK